MTLAVMAGVVVVVLTSMGWIFQPYAEKLVLVNATISIDGKLYTSSATHLLTRQDKSGFGFQGGFEYSAFGDAIAFKVGDATILLLPNPGLIPCDSRAEWAFDGMKQFRDYSGSCRVVDKSAAVVYVGDEMQNPLRVTSVIFNQNGHLDESVSSTFGPELDEILARNVFIDNIDIEVISGPVTTGLLEAYPWLAALPSKTSPQFGCVASSRTIYAEDVSRQEGDC